MWDAPYVAPHSLALCVNRIKAFMEEIVETAIKAFWSFIRFIFWTVSFEIIAFNFGRAIIFVFTFGKHPKPNLTDKDTDKIAIFGLLVFIAILICIGLYNNANT